MLSRKPVLPNFIRALLIASLTLGGAAVFAGHHEEGEKISDLKSMKSKHADKVDKMSKKYKTEDVKSALKAEPTESMTKHEGMIKKVEDAKPDQ